MRLMRPKRKSFVSCLVMLMVLCSFFWLALPEGAGASEQAAATELTVKLNGATLATYSISELAQMPQVTQGYSSIDSMPAPCMTAARGVKVTDILISAGIDVDSVQKITFKSTDGYAIPLTKQFLLDTNRYYYPHLVNEWVSFESNNYEPALRDGVRVEPILALVSHYQRNIPEPNFDLMDDTVALRLCFGQDPDNITEGTSSKFAKYVNEMNVEGEPVEEPVTATPPVLMADTSDNTVGQPVTVSFADDASWRAAITGVSVNGATLGGSQYSVTAGAVTINAGVFNAAGTYQIVVKATGYHDAGVTQVMREAAAPGAGTITLNLSKSTATVGERVRASGVAASNSWVAVKVLDSDQNIVVFDAVTAGADGSYSIDFIIPDGADGSLTVVAGAGSIVANRKITVTTGGSGGGGGGSSGGGGGGGSSTTTPAVYATNGAAQVTPAAGGTISLGGAVTVKIPASALQGTAKTEVKVTKATAPAAIPAGFKLVGSVYEFSVGGQSSYKFSKNVTLTFQFDPAALSPGETPAVYYYDQAQGQWVSLGGTVSGTTITVQVDHFTMFAVLAASEPDMTDIAGHWAQDKISKLVSLGAINGYPDGSFRPDNTMTRAEFATVLVKAFKLAPQSGKVFADTAGHWAKDYVATAASYGIVGGYDENTFGPEDLITREQMAVMIVKAAKLDAVTGETDFTDSKNISGWAEAAVAAAVGNGIMKGYPDNTFQPQGNATRAEAVTVIANTLD